ncbi:MAG: hypothetical protein ACK5LV_07615 [Lachnospirales bacterium]
MAVVQEAFDIPMDILEKILTGEYRRIGGVVRYAVGSNKGQIVKHLEPVDLKVSEQTQSIGAKVVQFAKNNKKAFIVVGIGIGIVTAGAGVYYKIKKAEPKVITNFKSALEEYIKAVRVGNLDAKEIDALMIALDEIKKHKDYEKMNIQLSTEELSVLVIKISEYTIKLANNNAVDITEDEKDVSGASENTMAILQKYLNVQKKIFEMAA